MGRSVASVALLAVLTSCAPTVPERDAAADAAEAEAVIVAFFDAIERFAFDDIRSHVTADFEIIEDVALFDTEGFVGLLEPFAGSGATIEYAFSDFRTEVSGSVAWTRYRNNAAMTMNGEDTHFEWVETAVLQRVGPAWKIDRLHSVPVEASAESGGDG